MKKKLVIAAIVVLLLSLSGVYYYSQTALSVSVVKVEQGMLQDILTEDGMVEARVSSHLLAQVSGQIREIYVETGDNVAQGEALMALSTEQVDLQIKALEARLRSVEAAYAEADKPVDTERLENAALSIESIKTRLALAKEQRDKSLSLYQQNVITYDAYQQTENNYLMLKNELSIAENEYQLLLKGVSENIKNQYEAQISEINYSIEQLRSTREYYVLTAPIQGTITELFIHQGDTVIPSMPLITVADLTSLFVQSDVLADKASQIQVGAPTSISFDDLNLQIEGLTVDKIHPVARTIISDLGIEQKRVRLEVGLPVDSQLRAGYEVDVAMVLTEKSDVLYIPEECMITQNGENFVFLVKNNKAIQQPITIGLQTKDDIEVLSGLSAGDQIVISPPEEIKDGSKVSIEE